MSPRHKIFFFLTIGTYFCTRFLLLKLLWFYIKKYELRLCYPTPSTSTYILRFEKISLQVLWIAFQNINCLFQISLTGSCYTTIAITIERFLAIRSPFFIQKHNVNARVFILPIAIYCLVYNSPRFFEYEILYLGCVEFKNGSHSTLAYDLAHNITCEFVYTLDYSEMRKTQLYISVSTKPFKII